MKFLFLSVLYFLVSGLMAQGKLRSTCADNTAISIQESIAFYQERLSMDSSDQVSYYTIAMSFYKLGKYVDAIEYFNKLEILNPEYPMLYATRGICKMLSGNKPGACNDFGLSVIRGIDPEIMNGEKLSQWMNRECMGHEKSAFQILYEKQVCPNFTVPGFDHSSFSLRPFGNVTNFW